MKEVDAESLRGVAHHEPSNLYVWYVIILLASVNMFSFMDRMALAVLAGPIKADIHLSDTELGLLTGFAFALFYAVCGLPIARWADRGNRRNIIALAVTVWSAMTALTGAAQNFWHLFLARVGVAVGEAGGHPPGQSIICDYVPFARRSGAVSVHTVGNAAGTMLGMALAGWLGNVIGWRWTFVALGIPGIALALVVRFTLREPVRGTFDGAKEKASSALPFRQTIGVLSQNRVYRLLVLFYVLNLFVQYGLLQWWPSFYVRVFALDLSSVGAYLGVAIGAGGGLGLLAGGFTADHVARRDARLPLKIGAAAMFLGLPAALGSLFAPSAGVAIFLVSVTLVFWGAATGPVLAMIVSVVRPNMRATASAITVLLSSILGTGLAPFCVGVVSDILAPSHGAESLRYALLVPICVIPVSGLVLLAAAGALPRDLRAMGENIETGPSAAPAAKLAVVK